MGRIHWGSMMLYLPTSWLTGEPGTGGLAAPSQGWRMAYLIEQYHSWASALLDPQMVHLATVDSTFKQLGPSGAESCTLRMSLIAIEPTTVISSLACVKYNESPESLKYRHSLHGIGFVAPSTNRGLSKNPSPSHIIAFYLSFISIGSWDVLVPFNCLIARGNSSSSSFCLGHTMLKSSFLTRIQPLVRIALLTASGVLPMRSDLTVPGISILA